MKIIFTSRGDQVLVSDIDHLRLMDDNWHTDGDGYAFKKKTIDKVVVYTKMHRLIANWMGLDLTQNIDHKDLNRLNNQRDNLRVATTSQNLHNTRGKSSVSGYKGVKRNRSSSYEAYINANNEYHYLGSFPTAEQAARIYDYFARKYHGEFARLNFPEEGESGV